MKERDGKQVTYVRGPYSNEYTQQEFDAAERIMTETGKAPNRKWRRFFERWKVSKSKQENGGVPV